jgi:hypothetical protein
VGVGNAIAANVPAAYQGVVNVLASGMVGGAISSAMGGNFWQGFTSAAVAAGVSLAANAVAGEIEASNDASGGDQSAGSQGASEYRVEAGPNDPDDAPIVDVKRDSLNANEQEVLDQIPMQDRMAKDVVQGNRELMVAEVPNSKGNLRPITAISEKAAEGDFRKVFSANTKSLSKLGIKGFDDLMDKAPATGHFHRSLAPMAEPPSKGDATRAWVARAAQGKAVYVRDSQSVYFLRAGAEGAHSWVRVAMPRTFDGTPF